MSRSHPAPLSNVRRLAPPRLSRKHAPPPPLNETKLGDLRIDKVRRAIHANQLTFPSPAPTFEKHDRPDLQWRFAQLYFVRRWNCEGIGTKYGLVHQRVRQILNTWTRRAIETGCIQFIPPFPLVVQVQVARSAAEVVLTGLPPFAAVDPPSMPVIPGTHWAGANRAKDLETRI